MEMPVTPTSVFASLSELPTRQFSEAAYQILILFRHRELLRQASVKQVLIPVQVQGVVKTSPSLWQNMSRSLKAIEEAGGMPLEDISDEKLLKYRKALDKLLADKAPVTPRSNAGSGRLVLNLLRGQDVIRR